MLTMRKGINPVTSPSGLLAPQCMQALLAGACLRPGVSGVATPCVLILWLEGARRASGARSGGIWRRESVQQFWPGNFKDLRTDDTQNQTTIKMSIMEKCGESTIIQSAGGYFI